MHGIRADLNVRTFKGLVLRPVEYRENIIYFRFAKPVNATRSELDIGVEGRWELHDRLGVVVASETVQYPLDPLPAAPFPVGDTVVACQVNPPQSFSLTFSGGLSLVIVDSNTKTESLSIPQLNVYV